MSQNFHQGIEDFSNEFERSARIKQGEWISQREMMRVQGFEPSVAMEVSNEEPPVVYDAGGMLTEMILPSWRKSATDILIDQIHSSHRWQFKQPLQAQMNQPELPLMNSKANSPTPSSYSLQMLLPNSSDSHLQSGSLVSSIPMDPPQFSWIENSNKANIGRITEGQGLTLSLSSPLPNFENAAATYYNYNQQGLTPPLMNQHLLHSSAMTTDHSGPVHVGFGVPQTGNMLKNSRYAKAAKELLEEFCCVGKETFKNQRVKMQNENPISSSKDGSSSSSKDHRPNLSASERSDYQRRKAKLLLMLDEIDTRYTRYCEQIQAMVNSFDTVMGYGAGVTYTALAQKAMSRHFRCIKDAILEQLKIACEFLGEKDLSGSSGLTKGETPRLRLLEAKFRQQKAIHQMGMLDSDAWRPQRGLPDQSVNILRAWLFENFLHPYPSEADKHLLSRQTGLSKNQVSNWFINARVRLWKPMVEEMYQQEVKEDNQDQQETPTITKQQQEDNNSNKNGSKSDDHQCMHSAQISMLHDASSSSTTATTKIPLTGGKRSQINTNENDTSQCSINFKQYCMSMASRNQPAITSTTCHRVSPPPPTTVIPFSHSGDVSLSLGLKYSGSIPSKNQFSVNDFGEF